MAEHSMVEQIHQEHREWNRQHVHWLTDLERWVKEFDGASEKLGWCLENMGLLAAGYGAHREAMTAQEQEIARHEHHLKQGKQDHHDLAEHEMARRAQAYQQAFHDALRMEHDRFVALVNELEMTIASSIARRSRMARAL